MKLKYNKPKNRAISRIFELFIKLQVTVIFKNSKIQKNSVISTKNKNNFKLLLESEHEEFLKRSFWTTNNELQKTVWVVKSQKSKKTNNKKQKTKLQNKQKQNTKKQLWRAKNGYKNRNRNEKLGIAVLVIISQKRFVWCRSLDQKREMMES
jgi:hypothetical protein